MDLPYMFDACVQHAPEHEVAQTGPRADCLYEAPFVMLCSQRLRISNRGSGWRFQEMGVVLLVVDWPDGWRGVALAGIDHEKRQQCGGSE